MENVNDITIFKDEIAASSRILILLPDSANRDTLAASLALYLSLVELEKQVTIAYPKLPTVGQSHLFGINKLQTVIDNKNFVISLDYTEGSIEKVSYNIVEDKFNLVIEPRVGFEAAFDEKHVHFNHSSTDQDLVIVFGVTSFSQLGDYFSQNQTLFQEKAVILINNKAAQDKAKINLIQITPTVSSIVSQLIKLAELPMNPDIASNLYDGLIAGTRNFSIVEIDATTFEAAAWLLRQGAKRKNTRQEEAPQQEIAASKPIEKPQAPPDWLKPKIYKGSQGPALL